MILNSDTHKDGFNTAIISSNKKINERAIDENKIGVLDQLVKSNSAEIANIQRLLDYFFKIQELTENFGGN